MTAATTAVFRATNKFLPVLNGNESGISLIMVSNGRNFELDDELITTFETNDIGHNDVISWFNKARLGSSDAEVQTEFYNAVRTLISWGDSRKEAVRSLWDDPTAAIYLQLSPGRLAALFKGLGIHNQNTVNMTREEKAQTLAQFHTNPEEYMKAFRGIAVMGTGETDNVDPNDLVEISGAVSTTKWKTLGNYEEGLDDFNLNVFNSKGFRAYASHRPDVNRTVLDVNNLINILIKVKTPIRLIGPPGCGKSIVGRWIAKSLKMPCELVPCSEALTEEQLFGMYRPVANGGIEWVDGQLPKICRQAKGLIVFDEWDHLPPDIASKLHQLLAERRFTLQSGEVICLHDGVKMIFTSNTSGHGNLNRKHSAAKVSDHAFLSRLPIAMQVGYMNEAEEVALLETVFNVPNDIATKWVMFANNIRTSVELADQDPSRGAGEQTITIRESMAFGELIKAGTDPKTAFSLVLSGFSHGDRLTYGTTAEKIFGWSV